MQIRSLMSSASGEHARLKDRAKLSLGSIIYPIQTRRWLQFLTENPVLGELAKSYPRLIHKIYRPYVSNHLSCAERVDLLIGHYGLLFQSGLGELVRQAALRPITVSEFSGKSGTRFELQLSAINVGHREGELCLRLVSNGVCIYSVAFILLVLHGEHYIKIGCLQGLRSINGPLWIKRVTRDLHGCRPKNLMVSVVRDIGDYFGCKSALLVSNKNRIAINPWRRRQISANYDETWEEMCATRREDEDFELPCRGFHQLRLDMLASKKRSEAKKRSALIASIFASVRTHLDGARSAALPIRSLPPAQAVQSKLGDAGLLGI